MSLRPPAVTGGRGSRGRRCGRGRGTATADGGRRLRGRRRVGEAVGGGGAEACRYGRGHVTAVADVTSVADEATGRPQRLSPP